MSKDPVAVVDDVPAKAVAPAPVLTPTPEPQPAAESAPALAESEAAPVPALAGNDVTPAPEPAASEVPPIPAAAGHQDVKIPYNINMEHAMKTITDVNEFAKGNIEALIESAKAVTAGAETLTAAAVEQSKKNFEEAQEAFKALTAAKTPNEALQLQTEFAKSQFEKGVAVWSQWSETLLKVSGEVFQPLSNRLAVASETVRNNVAA